MKQRTLKYGLAGLAIASSLSVSASNIVIDDFGNEGDGDEPNVVTLVRPLATSPKFASAGFTYGNAVGGFRDAAVWSSAIGSYAAGVAFGSGGYASFTGAGEGALVWDGTQGIDDDVTDNDELDITELDLDLDLSIDCVNPKIEISAFADLAGASVNIVLVTDYTNYSLYTIALSSLPLNTFHDYSVALNAPTLTGADGAVNPLDVNAIAMYIDGSGMPNLDVLVNRFVISCPDGGATLALMGGGLLGLAMLRRQVAR